jgi:tyrosyl-tRNA synthetase
VRFNSEWLEPLGSFGWVRLAAKYNVAQMLERREFKTRYESGKPIAVHEFLYPLAQAYDSVFLEADVELGGTDQLFNLNVGRDIMPAFGLEAQVVMTTPLLEGLDGVEKMSKSLGNYVGVSDEPAEMFGKVMSISDDLMWKYYTLLTDLGPTEISTLRSRVASGDVHPKQAKVDLAKRITADFHGAAAADRAADEFERRFAKKEVTESSVVAVPITIPPDGSIRLSRVMVEADLAESSSSATRKIQQGGVRVDRAKVTDPNTRYTKENSGFLLEVGRKIVRITFS